MRALTHAAFSALFLFGTSTLLHLRPDGAAVGIAMAASQLPDLDAPESFVGSLFRPISERLAARFGHRTITHSLVGLGIFSGLAGPLLFIKPLWWAAFVLGYLSHLLADSLTVQGVPLYWPHPRPAFLLGKGRAIATGTMQEGFFLMGVLILIWPVWWLSQHGLLGAVRNVMADLDQTYAQYRELAANSEVFLTGSFQDNLTKARFEASLRIVDLLQAGYVVEAGGMTAASTGPQPQELLSVGKDEAHDLYPFRVRLRAGQPIREVVVTVDLAGRSVGELLGFVDASKEHYIVGSLELEEAIEAPAALRRYKPVSGEKTLELKLARWRDLEAFKDVKVKTGSVIIRHRLKPGEQLFFYRPKAESEAVAPQAQIELEFEVSSLKEVFIKPGDRIEIGQLLALGPSARELIRRQMELLELAKEVERVKKRVELGLADPGEYKNVFGKFRQAELEIAFLEASREIRSPIAGLIEALKVEGAGQGIKLRVLIRLVE